MQDSTPRGAVQTMCKTLKQGQRTVVLRVPPPYPTRTTRRVLGRGGLRPLPPSPSPRSQAVVGVVSGLAYFFAVGSTAQVTSSDTRGVPPLSGRGTNHRWAPGGSLTGNLLPFPAEDGPCLRWHSTTTAPLLPSNPLLYDPPTPVTGGAPTPSDVLRGSLTRSWCVGFRSSWPDCSG